MKLLVSYFMYEIVRELYVWRSWVIVVCMKFASYCKHEVVRELLLYIWNCSWNSHGRTHTRTLSLILFVRLTFVHVS